MVTMTDIRPYLDKKLTLDDFAEIVGRLFGVRVVEASEHVAIGCQQRCFYPRVEDGRVVGGFFR
jgi:Zn-dependent oligopeptidase